MKRTNFILLIFLIAAIGSAGGCSVARKICGALSIRYCKENTQLKVYSDVQERTANGILIASRDGVSNEFKAVADASLNDLFADASVRGYSNMLAFSDYVIFVLPDCTLSPVYQVPSFRLRADDYDGTEFDIDPRPGIGYIYASEHVITSGNAPTNSYVICNDVPTARANVRHGAEHIILFNNDGAEYERTKFHGFGISHPIIPPRPQ